MTTLTKKNKTKNLLLLLEKVCNITKTNSHRCQLANIVKNYFSKIKKKGVYIYY